MNKQSKHLATRGLLTLLLVLSSFNHLHAQNKGRSEKIREERRRLP
jgi:hypothetical protein